VICKFPGMGNGILLNGVGVFISSAREFLGIEGGHQPWSMERFEALYRRGLPWIDPANPERFIDKFAWGNGQDTRIGLLILG